MIWARGTGTYDSMTKCKDINPNYVPCDNDALTNQALCPLHREELAKKAAKESARSADNKSALAKAADKTSRAFAMMTITPTPGTEKEYAEAKKEEGILKARVKSDDEKHEKELMTQKTKNAVIVALRQELCLLPVTTQCYALNPITPHAQCTSAPTSCDGLCDGHRTTLVDKLSCVSLVLANPLPPFRFALQQNYVILENAVRAGVRAARIARFGIAALDVANPSAGGGGGGGGGGGLGVVPPPRRIAAEPTLTAPVDVAPHIAKQHLEMSEALGKPITCPICYDSVVPSNIIMTHCGHVYCTPCLTAARERERKCPQCRVVI